MPTVLKSVVVEAPVETVLVSMNGKTPCDS